MHSCSAWNGRSASRFATNISSIKTCNCNSCNLAAVPGYSNHQSGHALDLVFNMSRTELELRMRPTLEKSIEVCKLAMKRSGLTVGDIDSVIMVGGSTRVPLVRELVTEFFGQLRTDTLPSDDSAFDVTREGLVYRFAAGSMVRSRNWFHIRQSSARSTPMTPTDAFGLSQDQAREIGIAIARTN